MEVAGGVQWPGLKQGAPQKERVRTLEERLGKSLKNTPMQLDIRNRRSLNYSRSEPALLISQARKKRPTTTKIVRGFMGGTDDLNLPDLKEFGLR